jgi:hypothetical protein
VHAGHWTRQKTRIRCHREEATPVLGNRRVAECGYEWPKRRCQIVEYTQIEGCIRDAELWIVPWIDRYRVALHAAHHQPAARGSQIGGGIDDAGDRLLWRHACDRPGDEKLVPHRRHRHVNPS